MKKTLLSTKGGGSCFQASRYGSRTWRRSSWRNKNSKRIWSWGRGSFDLQLMQPLAKEKIQVRKRIRISNRPLTIGSWWIESRRGRPKKKRAWWGTPWSIQSKEEKHSKAPFLMKRLERHKFRPSNGSREKPGSRLILRRSRCRTVSIISSSCQLCPSTSRDQT